MAKTSSVEKNNRRRKLVAQFAVKRKKLKELAKDRSKPAEERFRRAFEAGAVATQLLGDAHQEPLRDHRALPRLLPQAQNLPQPAPRARQPGVDPRHGEVELVGGKT